MKRDCRRAFPHDNYKKTTSTLVVVVILTFKTSESKKMNNSLFLENIIEYRLLRILFFVLFDIVIDI